MNDNGGNGTVRRWRVMYTDLSQNYYNTDGVRVGPTKTLTVDAETIDQAESVFLSTAAVKQFSLVSIESMPLGISKR